MRDQLAHPRSRCRAHPSRRRHRGRGGLPGRPRRPQRTRGALRPGGLGGDGLAGGAGHGLGRAAGHPARHGRRPSTRLGGRAAGRPDDLGLRLDPARRALRKRRTPRPPTSTASGSTPSPCGATTPTSPWPPCCDRATPRRTTPTTTSNSSSRPCSPCPPRTALGHEEGDDPALVRPPHLGPGRLGRGHASLRRSPHRRQLRVLDRLSHQRFCA